MTPHNFLITERINEAKVHLQTTNMSIHEISIMVGFKSESNFISKFKAIYNTTPQAYRQQTRYAAKQQPV